MPLAARFFTVSNSSNDRTVVAFLLSRAVQIRSRDRHKLSVTEGGTLGANAGVVERQTLRL
jgi:hypothetical protein